MLDRQEWQKRVAENGFSLKSLGWSNARSQTVRFRVLSEIGLCNGCSVLDVGCGFADFSDFLVQRSYLPHDFTLYLYRRTKHERGLDF